MKKNLAVLAPYIIALGTDFYLLPLLMKDTGTAMVMMLCIMPCIALGSGVIYGVCNGFSIAPSVAAFLLFLPTVFIFYNPSAWIYALVYAAVVLAGTGAGQVFHRGK